jgi:GDP-L-fucose synthase
MGSVCIYPKYADVPVKESSLLTGMLEPTNDAYAIAKIAGIKMCQSYRKQYGVDYISTMPCNLYGVNDNFHPTNSHVLPALIRRFHEAKINKLDEVVCWGDGSVRREFMNADDIADASLFLINNYNSDEIINVGYGDDYTIKEIVEIIKDIVDYDGKIIWDVTKPNGTPKRLLDSSKIFNMGWKPKVNLKDGLKNTYNWYINRSNTI